MTFSRDRRVSSWNELQEELFAEAWNPELGRYRSRFAFRGLSDAGYNSLATTLRRLGSDYATLEPHLLRNFKKYAHRSAVQRDSPWHWLSVVQHYGLPTRLLDWTYSLFVALHFATANIERFDRNHLGGQLSQGSPTPAGIPPPLPRNGGRQRFYRRNAVGNPAGP